MVVEKECRFSSNNGLKLDECYITAIMCHILGYSDQCYVLTEIRNFRKYIVHKNPYCLVDLSEYDAIEPIIAEDIEKEYEEKHNKDMWARIYQLYLSQVANLIALHRYEDAICKYQQMIEVLKDYFGIQEVDSNIYQNGNMQFKRKQLVANM